MKSLIFLFALMLLCHTAVFAGSAFKRAQQQILAPSDIDVDIDSEAESTIASETESESDTHAVVDSEIEHAGALDSGVMIGSSTPHVPIVAVKNQAYCHGACMGAATAMLADPIWNAIYARVLPDLYAVTTPLLNGPVDKIQLNMENNPVLAAYGSVHHMLRLDPSNVMVEAEKCKSLLRHEWDLWMNDANPGDVASAKLAHGGKWTTIAQAIFSGFAVGVKFSDVKGAPSPSVWLSAFGQAIELYRWTVKNKQTSAAAIKNAPMSSNAVAIASPFFRATGGLYLDVKSTYSSSAALPQFISAVEKAFNILIVGVGTFKHEQLSALQKPVRAVKFYHTHYGVLADKANLKAGETVMFNAGSFVDAKTNTISQSEVDAFDLLKKQLNLSVAVYVQEPGSSVAALNAVTNLVNSRADLFALGFAYGNIAALADPKATGNGLGIQAPMYTTDKVKFKTVSIISAIRN